MIDWFPDEGIPEPFREPKRKPRLGVQTVEEVIHLRKKLDQYERQFTECYDDPNFQALYWELRKALNELELMKR